MTRFQSENSQGGYDTSVLGLILTPSSMALATRISQQLPTQSLPARNPNIQFDAWISYAARYLFVQTPFPRLLIIVLWPASCKTVKDFFPLCRTNRIRNPKKTRFSLPHGIVDAQVPIDFPVFQYCSIEIG